MASEGLSVRLVHDAPAGLGVHLDVALEVPPGITVLIGPSGAGKTTTLAAIAGLWRPARGRIALDGRVLFDSDQGIDVAIHQRHIGFVFQSLALFPHLSAWANVAYGLPRRLAAAERRRCATEWLERCHVAHVAERRPATFSGGEAQRVALARALASEPTVLLLDEPLSAIDGPLRAELRRQLKELVAQAGIPTLFVTHDRDDAAALGERVARLSGGCTVAADGAPAG